MKIEKITLGNLRSNCYILSENKNALIVDPGYESQDVINYVNSNDLNVEAIYITHCHFDHIGGVKQLKELYNPKVYAPRKDSMWIDNPSYNQLGYITPVDQWVNEGDEIQFSSKTFIVYETPGHSPGSTVLYNDRVLFSGDTLFFQSIGRTDIPLSDSKIIYQSVKKIYDLFDDDVIVYPGHGKPTSIFHEKNNNPFVRK
ncbi:MBL fold metallo-hydrolase [Peloplasma aerotolerans]|jgi:hydroxyacylglutathione hydrolase|uniref:MBL fold metallo-hydrolase n=1 Tax=Peloplasma aerotolerans TaxID=3044389 RepID=A0AAW6U7M9_9MOLU|nr:MBL fold metallo-hydrolase [Mariniplasma sp. M4Ah]MDI6452624.1 MBL fold metallo-hydrolase [Mariniplasma sp. M4Ah]